MQGNSQFYVTGKLQRSGTGHSFKIYSLDPNGTWVFIGLISRKALSALLEGKFSISNICKFETPIIQNNQEII